ncbi:MAG: 2-oxoglutarate dehydrogenase complex dihydrolipoyllysine-residue succinyltransferase [Verrucomicrobia bacterium]|jgi:2-oxoglutarate dehydrogenase E2 component (dihydrolipoamide succinyltransferase)|nr:2-oxoglutarate dehydrogenase complex dihydrolipoyllysine-residue succinyltransferase [Verrucomicrobiota bacterium]
MPDEIKVPELGESITEVQIAEWLVKQGDSIEKDQDIVRVESEKATVEIPAPAAGTLAKILKKDGATAKVGDVIGQIESDAKKKDRSKESTSDEAEDESVPESATSKKAKKQHGAKQEKPGEEDGRAKSSGQAEPRSMPAAQRLLEEHGLAADEVKASGPGGRLLKEDVLAHVKEARPPESPGDVTKDLSTPASPAGDREEEIKPMTPLRRTVAKRLVAAQHTMAILTTFNEIDMTEVMALRKQYQEDFQAKYGVKLGFVSFFVKSVIEALKEVPQLNAEIRGDDILYHRYFDIGVAIGAGKGLVVPPLRNAERLSFAGIEKTVADLAARAKDNKLKPDELEGGTFTISNGGVYGSLLSTPIINPPQSGILGLHAIQERPVALAGEVVIRPMMYVALSYDHRIVDGREAVTFLRRVKDIIEDPARLMLEV